MHGSLTDSELSLEMMRYRRQAAMTGGLIPKKLDLR